MKNYALVGKTLGHSLSPLIHSRVFAEKNEPASYTLLEIPEERLPMLLPALRTLGFGGVNITIPYKKALLPYFDTLSPEVLRIGAANTAGFSAEGSAAANTDYYGFGALLRRNGIPCEGGSAIILGTGGAALAAGAYLIDHGVSRLAFASRSPGGELLGCPIIPYSKLAKADLVVNSTPLGMHPNTEASPLDKNRLALFESAVDLIYNPFQTLFVREALDLGLNAAGGLEMLVGQALEAQRFWNGWVFEDSFFEGLCREMRQALEHP